MTLRVLSLSMDEREWSWLDQQAAEAGLSRSALLRELIFAVSDCRPKWAGLGLRWERPKFRWGKNEEERYL